MHRRGTRRPSNPQPVLHGQAVNHSRAIVLVDGADIRKKIKKSYEKALRDFDHSRRLLDQFHQKDLPQFTHWLNGHFGAQLTELRELNQKMQADEAIVFFVENEVLFGGGSYARAYQRLMELQENPAPRPRPPEAEDAGKKGPLAGGPESGNFDEEVEDLIEEFMREFFPNLGPGSDPCEPHGSRAGRTTGMAPEPASPRLKELYRAVVRRLHPDTQREMTAQKTESWHQAQAAYAAGDVQQLELILTLLDIGESGTTAHTSASLLQRITAQLKSSLREIKRQITQRRREPAWNFSGRADHALLLLRMRRELMDELAEMRCRWKETQEMIAKWKAAAEKLKRPRRRKAQPHHPDGPF